MTQRKCNFTFNSAITGMSKENGTFDDDAHRDQVLPVRGRIMQLDGVTGCHIARYGMEIGFLDEVVDRDTVETHGMEAITWAGTLDGLFPLRGNKTPAATMDRPAHRETHSWWVKVTFASYLVRYTPAADDGWDAEAFRTETGSLEKEMTNLSGIINHELRPGFAKVKFDDRYISKEAVEAHLRQLFLSVQERSANFFPFVPEGETIELEFKCFEG